MPRQFVNGTGHISIRVDTPITEDEYRCLDMAIHEVLTEAGVTGVIDDDVTGQLILVG